MQATLDAAALKPFTRALTCLSKYGDELSIYGTPESLSLSAVNSSKSAYCRFKYDKEFFSRYRVGSAVANRQNVVDEVEEVLTVTGQLLTKSLLSILKHRTVEKAVERCELSIVEGAQTKDGEEEDENQDGLESKLVVKLHCKHGVTKTHRLLLLTPTSLMAPGIPDALNESRLTIGPKALKDMIEHFPVNRGVKSDPQLVWSFGETEVGLKSLESSIDSRGKGQLSTELTISADEFDVYDIYTSPITIAFHLREFNATIAFADSMTLPLDLRFTDPAAPLFVDVEGDCSETLFVISTSQVHGVTGSTQSQSSGINARKREREETTAPTETPRIKKPMKVVQPATSPGFRSSGSSSRSQSRILGSMPPPTLVPRTGILFLQPPQAESTRNSMRPTQYHPHPSPPSAHYSEPLFLPASSQLSQADVEVLRSTGLGIEDMDAAELAEMLEGEGEEVAFDFASQAPGSDTHNSDEMAAMLVDDGPDSFEVVGEAELTATQSSDDQFKAFQPLFED